MASYSGGGDGNCCGGMLVKGWYLGNGDEKRIHFNGLAAAWRGINGGAGGGNGKIIRKCLW